MKSIEEWFGQFNKDGFPKENESLEDYGIRIIHGLENELGNEEGCGDNDPEFPNITNTEKDKTE